MAYGGSVFRPPFPHVILTRRLVAVTPHYDYSQTPSDTVTLADAAAIGFGKNVADTVSLSDSASVAIIIPVSVNDTVNATDAVVLDFGKAISDNPSITEVLAIDFSTGFTDTVSLADATTPALTFGFSLSDSTTSSDAASIGYGLNPTDTATPADAIATDFGKALNDSSTSSDAVVKDIGLNKTESSVTLADSATVSKVTIINVSDTVIVVDADAKAVSMPLADTVALTDLASKLLPPITLSDSITISDDQIRAVRLKTGKAHARLSPDLLARARLQGIDVLVGSQQVRARPSS